MERKRSILIVDDELDMSQMTKMLLEKTGLYAVRVCNRGREAYRMTQELRPDLVLLDIMMPDADGADIARQIREDASLKATQVVFMTSLISQQETRDHSLIGGHFFISKPISGEALLQRVKGFFEIGKK